MESRAAIIIMKWYRWRWSLVKLSSGEVTMKKSCVVRESKPVKFDEEKRLGLRLDNEEFLDALMKYPPKNFKNSYGGKIIAGRS
jgi:hypothetical protein